MITSHPTSTSSSLWTLKKAVTTLAIATQTESLTRTGRMAYNVMVFKAQKMVCDEEGGFTAPLSEIIKGFGATTRDSPRVKAYIEQMCSTVVRWFPLSAGDQAQASLEEVDLPVPDMNTDGRIFTLLAEVRFFKRSGEQWLTWFFPPTIRDILIHPSRWAQIDIRELAALSHYAGVALYEICARYRDVPGGLTNKAAPEFWVTTLRPDSDTKPREWRKFKNETLKPAITEINHRTSLDVRLVEFRQGRGVSAVQFAVKRKQSETVLTAVDISLVEHATALRIKERDLDQLVDEYSEDQVKKAITAIEGRMRAQPTVEIKSAVAYVRATLRNGATGSLFALQPERTPEPRRIQPGEAAEPAWLTVRRAEIQAHLDSLEPGSLERYATMAQEQLAAKRMLTPSVQKRFDSGQYRSPMVWDSIRRAYAEERFGADWQSQPPVKA